MEETRQEMVCNRWDVSRAGAREGHARWEETGLTAVSQAFGSSPLCHHWWWDRGDGPFSSHNEEVSSQVF